MPTTQRYLLLAARQRSAYQLTEPTASAETCRAENAHFAGASDCLADDAYLMFRYCWCRPPPLKMFYTQDGI